MKHNIMTHHNVPEARSIPNIPNDAAHFGILVSQRFLSIFAPAKAGKNSTPSLAPGATINPACKETGTACD